MNLDSKQVQIAHTLFKKRKRDVPFLVLSNRQMLVSHASSEAAAFGLFWSSGDCAHKGFGVLYFVAFNEILQN